MSRRQPDLTSIGLARRPRQLASLYQPRPGLPAGVGFLAMLGTTTRDAIVGVTFGWVTKRKANQTITAISARAGINHSQEESTCPTTVHFLTMSMLPPKMQEGITKQGRGQPNQLSLSRAIRNVASKVPTVRGNANAGRTATLASVAAMRACHTHQKQGDTDEVQTMESGTLRQNYLVAVTGRMMVILDTKTSSDPAPFKKYC